MQWLHRDDPIGLSFGHGWGSSVKRGAALRLKGDQLSPITQQGQDLAEAIILFLSPLQEQYRDISSDPGRLRDSLELGAQKAQKVAGETLHAVYERVGFVPRRR